MKANVTARPEPHLALLGKPKRALIDKFGEPISETPYRGKTALLFEAGDETVICETLSDTVLSINSFKDRRLSMRIKPQTKKKAYLSHNGDRHLVTVIDISANSVAIKMPSGNLSEEDKNCKVEFCTTLELWSNVRAHIILSGYIYKVIPETETIVVIFNVEPKTQSHRSLQDFINHSRIKEHLSPFITNCPGNQVSKIIKSDACIIKCDDNKCSLL